MWRTKMASQDATQILKRELRKRIQATLKSLPQQQIVHESAYLTKHLQAHAAYQKAKTIALYVSQSTEMDTSHLITHALASQKRVFLPRVLSKSTRSMAMLEVQSMQDLASFDTGSYSIPEPPLSDGRARAPEDIGLDLIIVPGVAFNQRGHRLGHGMGFYDVYLQKYKEFGGKTGETMLMPQLISLALSVQNVPQVPVGDLDWVIDEVQFAPADEECKSQLNLN